MSVAGGGGSVLTVASTVSVVGVVSVHLRSPSADMTAVPRYVRRDIMTDNIFRQLRVRGVEWRSVERR